MNLNGADLTGANLADADLTEASMESANLEGADLEGANLNGICYDDATRWQVEVPPPSDVKNCEGSFVFRVFPQGPAAQVSP